jgi:delta14-sterol reductase/lamin-B receptor
MPRRSSRIAAKSSSAARTGRRSSSKPRASTPKKTTTTKNADATSSAPKAFVYEFGGPVGAVLTAVALPLVCYMFASFCNADDCTAVGLLAGIQGLVRDLAANPGEKLAALGVALAGTCTSGGFTAVFGWFLFQVLLERGLPGPSGKGTVLKGGKADRRLTYELNGHQAFWVSMGSLLLWQFVSVCRDASGGFRTIISMEEGAVASMCPAVNGVFDALLPRDQVHVPSLSWLFTHFTEMLTASLVLSTCMSIALYIASLRLPAGHADVAPGGDSGVAVYDFFMGRELNPRPLPGTTFDLKYFCELRPGLIGWCALNLGMLCYQVETNGMASGSMVLVNAFQLVYVWDALYNEKAILTTMDITTDGFGFMLCFGDLSWVPFTYSLQSRYLAFFDPGLSAVVLCTIFAAKVAGYRAFRGANGEKDAFRTDPNSARCAHLETITTKTGRKLLVSGWWGMARKINYTADWTMALSWCAVCGTNSLIPYFYAIYFAILLIHRAMRDDHACHEKYGDDWDRYKKRVPYVFIPGLV